MTELTGNWMPGTNDMMFISQTKKNSENRKGTYLSPCLPIESRAMRSRTNR